MSFGVSILKASEMLQIVSNLKDCDLSPLVLHSKDTAEIFRGIYKRVFGDYGADYAYLAGFFHDVGFVIFSQLLSADRITHITGLSPSKFGESFDLDKLLLYDRDLTHQTISSTIAKNLRIFPDEFIYAIENHHNPSAKLDGDDRRIILSLMLNISDTLAVILRQNLRSGVPDTFERIFKTLEVMDIPIEIKEAAKDFFNSEHEITYVLSDDDPVIDSGISLDFSQFIEFLKILVLSVDVKSPFTVKHSSTIAAVSRDIAKEIFRNEFDSEVLYVSALMHDLGKLRTPIEILHKPGRLGKFEMKVMKIHVADTFRMFSRFPQLTEFTVVASLHHERLDGSGYPWGMKGSEIGMRARILQVADVFVALTEKRPYREALKPKEALKIIEDEVNHGKLDPTVFEALREMIKNGYEVHQSDLIFLDFFKDLANLNFVRKIIDGI